MRKVMKSTETEEGAKAPTPITQEWVDKFNAAKGRAPLTLEAATYLLGEILTPEQREIILHQFDPDFIPPESWGGYDFWGFGHAL